MMAQVGKNEWQPMILLTRKEVFMFKDEEQGGLCGIKAVFPVLMAVPLERVFRCHIELKTYNSNIPYTRKFWSVK